MVLSIVPVCVLWLCIITGSRQVFLTLTFQIWLIANARRIITIMNLITKSYISRMLYEMYLQVLPGYTYYLYIYQFLFFLIVILYNTSSGSTEKKNGVQGSKTSEGQSKEHRNGLGDGTSPESEHICENCTRFIQNTFSCSTYILFSVNLRMNERNRLSLRGNPL